MTTFPVGKKSECRLVILSKNSSIQKQVLAIQRMRKNGQYKKGGGRGEVQSIVNISQILDLAGKDFKAAIINTSKALK